MSNWSIEKYCADQEASLEDWSVLPDSSRAFLERLRLPALHPFCTTFRDDFEAYYISSIPRQGPLHGSVHGSIWEWIVTIVTMAVPSLAAMGELWLRLFSSALAPLGITAMLHQMLLPYTKSNALSTDLVQRNLSLVCVLTVASSVVLLTDTLYVLQFGPHLGASSLAVSSVLSLLVCRKYKLARKTWISILGLVALAGFLIYDPQSSFLGGLPLTFGDPADRVEISEGLYFNSQNHLVQSIVSVWNPDDYSYKEATPWMPTGDSRTGLPFLMNKVKQPSYTRVWLPVEEHAGAASEVVALDISFPSTGHDATQPVFLVLHGLNGGSTEEYVRDFVWRQTLRNSTVAVMVARGLMDTPVRGWNMFHGARWTDAHESSIALRRATSPQQTLVAVGYSMGAIVLSNMVVQAGNSSVLDAAVAISGGLDMRQQKEFKRAQRLWQPMLCKELRQTFLLGKWGERVRSRLSHQTLMHMLRATHVTEIDESAVVHYNGFRDVVDYYEQMSALGDITAEEMAATIFPHRRVHQLAVPLLVVHALDDPLITFRTVAANRGAMHPTNLTATGTGNLMLLLTRKGGHVGWPIGWLPQLNTWYWMNNVAGTFASSVAAIKASRT